MIDIDLDPDTILGLTSMTFAEVYFINILSFVVLRTFSWSSLADIIVLNLIMSYLLT